MQQLTETLKTAIRSTFQVPIAKLEIYKADGTLEGTITDVKSCSVDVARSRKVKRTLKVSVNNDDGQYTPDPDLYDRNLFWYNKEIKVYYGFKTGPNNSIEEWLPQGVFTIDSINPDIQPDGSTLAIEGQETISNLIEDKFDDVYTVEDPDAVESVNYCLSTQGGTASASSSISVGDEIQTQGRIHYVQPYAIINGILTKVVNESTSDVKMIIDSDLSTSWEFRYTPKVGEIVTSIESEIFIDLQSTENVQEIVINFSAGAELKDFVWISPDNQTWTSYTSSTITPPDPVRFIKFMARKTTTNEDDSWSLGVSEVQIKTEDSFGPDKAIDGDWNGSQWKPRPVSLNPNAQIIFDMGSIRQINVIYLYWGDNSFDFWNRVSYFMEYAMEPGGPWTRITDLNGLDESKSLFGNVEHVFDLISTRYIRINIKSREGITKLRHIKSQQVTATQYLDKVIKDIAVGSGWNPDKIMIPMTRRFVKSKQADIGSEKYDFINSVAGSNGWIDPQTDENGYLITRPRDLNPVVPAWNFDVLTDNILSFTPTFTNDIKNVIVVVYKSSGGKAIVGRASDDNPLSPTYAGPGGIGRRVEKYEGESYNSKDICDKVAQERLFEHTRIRHQTSLPVTGHPAIQVDDVVTVTVPEAKVETVYYFVTGFTTDFDAESGQFDSKISISQI